MIVAFHGFFMHHYFVDQHIWRPGREPRLAARLGLPGCPEGDMSWRRATVLITGGTGTLGRRLVERLPAERRPRRVIAFYATSTSSTTCGRRG